MKKQELATLLLQDIQDYLSKLQEFESRRKNSLTCDNCFKNNDNYQGEKDILSEIFANIKCSCSSRSLSM